MCFRAYFNSMLNLNNELMKVQKQNLQIVN